MTTADALAVSVCLLAGIGAWAAVRTIDRLRWSVANLEHDLHWCREDASITREVLDAERLKLARERDLADGRLRLIVAEREEYAVVTRQLHEAIEDCNRLRRERDEARSRLRWVRRVDPPPGADARLLRVVVGGQASLLTEERLAEGMRRAEIVAGGWEEER